MQRGDPRDHHVHLHGHPAALPVAPCPIIEDAAHSLVATPLQPYFAALGYRTGAFPIAERACTELLGLPIHPALAAGAEDHVVDRIATFFRG